MWSRGENLSSSGSGIRQVLPPTTQPDAVLSQANPVSGTIYTVLATTANVRIRTISASVTWTVQPTPLEVRVVIDGQTFRFSQTDPVSTTPYYPQVNPNPAGDEDTQICITGLRTDTLITGFILEGKSVSVTAEITGGTVQNLSCRVKYAKW